ncbi:MAG: hypothetical protein IKU98_03455 [Bacteroidaceae bacterium]|nr:hypothetical protein [Bacteroidaceae bacterium]
MISAKWLLIVAIIFMVAWIISVVLTVMGINQDSFTDDDEDEFFKD